MGSHDESLASSILALAKLEYFFFWCPLYLFRYIHAWKSDDYRTQPSAVSPDANFNSIFTTSLQAGGHLLATWVCFAIGSHGLRTD